MLSLIYCLLTVINCAGTQAARLSKDWDAGGSPAGRFKVWGRRRLARGSFQSVGTRAARPRVVSKKRKILMVKFASALSAFCFSAVMTFLTQRLRSRVFCDYRRTRRRGRLRTRHCLYRRGIFIAYGSLRPAGAPENICKENSG